MKEEQVVSIAESLKGKKAKLKACDQAPNGTKAAKLPKEVAKGLGNHFNVDLSKVRVHTGGNAADLCKELGAKAFTQGTNIYLGKPGDAKNSKLLAHEITHVIQQSNGRLPKPKAGKALVSK